ncbi:hypothetical protein LCGC14_0763660 [marine sediment metagenome]|uniref:Uncharacterized protein n=1 Tax=marine sediment metagenome TaxID=412755 RepID=A0A0F9T7E4_9ZZZZ
MTPTQRTLARLKKDGMTCGIVEKWIQFGPNHPMRRPGFSMPGIRKDFLDIIDIIAFNDTETWGVQSCAGSGFAAHWRKLTVDRVEESQGWVACPSRRLFIYAWRKLKVKRGGKAMRWEARIEEINRGGER